MKLNTRREIPYVRAPMYYYPSDVICRGYLFRTVKQVNCIVLHCIPFKSCGQLQLQSLVRVSFVLNCNVLTRLKEPHQSNNAVDSKNVLLQISARTYTYASNLHVSIFGKCHRETITSHLHQNDQSWLVNYA